ARGAAGSGAPGRGPLGAHRLSRGRGTGSGRPAQGPPCRQCDRRGDRRRPRAVCRRPGARQWWRRVLLVSSPRRRGRARRHPRTRSLPCLRPLPGPRVGGAARPRLLPARPRLDVADDADRRRDVCGEGVPAPGRRRRHAMRDHWIFAAAPSVAAGIAIAVMAVRSARTREGSGPRPARRMPFGAIAHLAWIAAIGLVALAHMAALAFPDAVLLWTRHPLRLVVIEIEGLVAGAAALSRTPQRLRRAPDDRPRS